MAAITWRNVDTPDIRGALAGFMGASNSINSGFDKLGELIKQREAIDNANWQNQRTNNTEDFYNQIAQKYTTPEAYQAAVASGEVQGLLQGYQGQVDKTAARNFMNNQMKTLQERTTAAQQYQEGQTKFTEQPAVRDIEAKIYGNQLADAATAMQANPALRDAPRLNKLLGEQATLVEKRNREAADYPLEHENKVLTGQKLKADLQEAERNRGETTLVKNAVSTMHNELLGLEKQREEGIKAVADTYKIPFKDGMPDVSGMSAQQAKVVHDELEKKGLLTSSSTTGAKEKLLAGLAKQGVSPTALTTANSLADTLFRTGVSLSAEDTEQRDSKLSAITDRVKKAGSTNIFYSDPETHAEDKVNVLDAVDKKLTDGPDTRLRLKNKMSKWMDSGLDIEDSTGKTINVKVPPKVMAQALAAGADQNSWIVNTSDSQMKALIQTMMTDPQYKALREEADYLHADGEAVSRAKIKKQYNNSSGTNNADVLATKLSDTLKARISALK